MRKIAITLLLLLVFILPADAKDNSEGKTQPNGLPVSYAPEEVIAALENAMTEVRYITSQFDDTKEYNKSLEESPSYIAGGYQIRKCGSVQAILDSDGSSLIGISEPFDLWVFLIYVDGKTEQSLYIWKNNGEYVFGGLHSNAVTLERGLIKFANQVEKLEMTSETYLLPYSGETGFVICADTTEGEKGLVTSYKDGDESLYDVEYIIGFQKTIIEEYKEKDKNKAGGGKDFADFVPTAVLNDNSFSIYWIVLIVLSLVILAGILLLVKRGNNAKAR